MTSLILFNRLNGLKAGELGALNASLAFYGSHLEDPEIVSSMGNLGPYFDFCAENRLIARELGGIQMFIHNIRNNFHGPYSDWAYELVKQSLFALAGGTWNNGDIAYDQGFIPLAVDLITEHGSQAKIAEEILQALKAMIYPSDFLRGEWCDQGLFEALAPVLRSRATDQAAVSLVCEGTMHLIGSTVLRDMNSTPRAIAFNASIQQKATDAKMLEALLATTTSEVDLQEFEHQGFSLSLDAIYPMKANCYHALRVLGKENPTNRKAMMQAGLSAAILKDWAGLDARARGEACQLLEELREWTAFRSRCV
ncbi:atpD [Symbiodinium sp. CCMP2592]|nr:atpD [Symbiodinium sp. CCMP2592]